MNVGGRPPQLVSALGAADAFDHARVLELQQNQFQELFRQRLFVGNIANANRALVVVPRQHHHGLQCVQTFLGDLHNVRKYAINSMVVIEFIGIRDISKFGARFAPIKGPRLSGLFSDVSRMMAKLPVDQDMHAHCSLAADSPHIPT